MTNFRQDNLLDAVTSNRSRREVSTLSVGSALYELGGLAAVIVDRIAGDATAHGWRCDIEDDESREMADEYSRLNAQPVFHEAAILARLTGAAAVLPLCDDSVSLLDPINEVNLGRISGLIAIAGDRITALDTTYQDSREQRFGEPIFYRVQPEHGSRYFEVHESRLIRVPGDVMPRGSFNGRSRLPWSGRPVLEGRGAQALARYEECLSWIPRLFEKKQQAVYAMSGLSETLSDTTIPGMEIVRQRIDITDSVRNLMNSAVIDKEDSYVINDLSLSGIAEAIRELKIAISAHHEYPVALLFGESAKGMNSTGESEANSYDLKVDRFQNRTLRQAIERLTFFIWNQNEFRFTEPPRWQIEFNARNTETEDQRIDREKRRAETRKLNADALTAIAGLQVTSPEENRKALQIVAPELELEDDLPLTLGADDDVSGGDDLAGTDRGVNNSARGVPDLTGNPGAA